MTGHEITIEHVDSLTKYRRPKRQYNAQCSCGWSSVSWPVQKWAAVDHGNGHHLRVKLNEETNDAPV